MSKVYKCIVVDDEPIARDIVKQYISQMPNLTLAGEFKNALDVLSIINGKDEIDILFLDINMPHLSGIELAKVINKKIQIIFTTAYSEHAVESYEIEATDYLLKPFLFDRFVKAVLKAINNIQSHPTQAIIHTTSKNTTHIYIKADGEFHPVMLDDILYCEASKNYTKVVCNHKIEYYTLKSISKLEEELSGLSNNFARVHRSFIVSKKDIQSLGASHVNVQGNKIPVGEYYRPQFYAQVGMH
jgi:DNA-binding LytR/AlgR family response regulator